MTVDGHAPAQPAQSPGAAALADMLAEQRVLTQLGLRDLHHRWNLQPPKSYLKFGTGQPEEQTIPGNPRLWFNGFLVLNGTGKNVRIGLEASGAIGSPLICPPGNAMVWAGEYENLSLAALATGPEETVTVLRLYYPPVQPMMFPYGRNCASVASAQPEDIAVGAASVVVLAANALRLGLEIVNIGEHAVRLGLGEAAKAAHGLWLAKAGGSWNGELGPSLWRGSVNAIEEGGASTLAVVEV